MSDPHTSKIPGKAVGADDVDLVDPAAELLRGLSLLPEKNATAGPMAAFTGTPDSVAVIEAGATALSKGWAAGLGASVVAVWAGVTAWWPDQDPDLQVAVMWGAAIATAALVAGVAYIVGSDVRGRAAASVATINARADVAEALIREAASLHAMQEEWARQDEKAKDEKAKEQAAVEHVVPISPPQQMRWIRRKGPDEEGWYASAFRVQGDKTDYWLAKGSIQEWVPSSDVERG